MRCKQLVFSHRMIAVIVSINAANCAITANSHDANINECLDKFVAKKAKSLRKQRLATLSLHQWVIDDRFVESVDEVYKMIVKMKLNIGEVNLNNRSDLSPTQEEKNRLLLCQILSIIDRAGILDEKTVVVAKSAFSWADIDERAEDALKYIEATGAEEVVLHLDSHSIKREFEEFCRKEQERQTAARQAEIIHSPATIQQETVNTPEPNNVPRGTFEVNGSALSADVAKREIATESEVPRETPRVRNLWDILEMQEKTGGVYALNESMRAKLMEISPLYEATKMIVFKGDLRAAVAQYSTSARVAIVHFAGENENRDAWPAPELENLLRENSSRGAVGRMAEEDLYIEGVKLAKTLKNGQARADNAQAEVDVIRVVALQQADSKDELRAEIERKIRAQMAMAVLGGDEILITSREWCDLELVEPCEELEIYKKIVRDPLFAGKIRALVFIWSAGLAR